MLLREIEIEIDRERGGSHEERHSYLTQDYPPAPNHLIEFDHLNTNIMNYWSILQPLRFNLVISMCKTLNIRCQIPNFGLKI